MKNEMDWACSMYGGGMHTRVWWGNLLDRDPLEDQSVDGRIILRCIFKKWDVGCRLD
jgi:hypothetical protein